jgi:hypothetical protein
MSELPPQGPTQDSREEAQRLLAPFAITDERARREVWTAWNINPEGVERCVLEARVLGKRAGNTGAGLLVTMIRRGDHLIEVDPTAKRITGWRWVTGVGHAAGTYVRDPEGTDKLPPGYDLSTRSPIYEPAPTYDDAAPINDTVKGELARLTGRE